MDMQDIQERLLSLSSASKVPGGMRKKVYSSFTVPGLDGIRAKRDTLARLKAFGVPDSLKGKTALDVGCNCGAVSFELARRGAAVVGYEYSSDRVDVANDVSAALGMTAAFFHHDLNALQPLDQEGVCDVVWCASVDRYIKERGAFYRWLRAMCRDGGTLYLESNTRRVDVEAELRAAGFDDVESLGKSEGSRTMFRAKAAVDVIEDEPEEASSWPGAIEGMSAKEPSDGEPES